MTALVVPPFHPNEKVKHMTPSDSSNIIPLDRLALRFEEKMTDRHLTALTTARQNQHGFTPQQQWTST
jgi:hypothetical protein